jgi:sec-independent protein translocase protein TatC
MLQENIFELAEDLRRAIIHALLVTGVFAIGGYYGARPLVVYLQGLTGAKLVAYGLPDTVFAFLKIALAIGAAAGMPYTLYRLLAVLPAHFPSFSRRVLLGFWLISLLLFALGVVFCLKVTLPYGIQFLLSFETPGIVALISVKKFVSFCLWLFFGFGLIFELPLVMITLSRIGIVRCVTLAAYRRHAIVAITVASAVITPTPDIFNMLLMAVPLYLLFEIGLIGMRFWGQG